MSETNKTIVSFSIGSVLLLSVLTIAVCVTLLIGMREAHDSVSQVRTAPTGNTGNIGNMSAIEAEAAYGKVNQSAAQEKKQGIFFRRRSCAQQSYCQQSQQSYRYYASRPVYSSPVYQTPVRTFGTSPCLPCQNQSAQYSYPTAPCINGACQPNSTVINQPVVQPSYPPPVIVPVAEETFKIVSVDETLYIKPSL